MKENEIKLLISRGGLIYSIEKCINGKYYEIYEDKYNGKERFRKKISKSKYYRLNDKWTRGIIVPRCKAITIKRLAKLIENKSDYHITEWDSEFVAKELIRLNYCKIKVTGSKSNW